MGDVITRGREALECCLPRGTNRIECYLSISKQRGEKKQSLVSLHLDKNKYLNGNQSKNKSKKKNRC